MKQDGIAPKDIMDSLDNDCNRKRIFQAGEGAGQSGSFFFFSQDNKFIIKTMRGSERQVLIDILDDYI